MDENLYMHMLLNNRVVLALISKSLKQFYYFELGFRGDSSMWNLDIIKLFLKTKS